MTKLCKYIGGSLDGQALETEHASREMRRPLTQEDEVYRARVIDRTNGTVTYTYERNEPRNT